MSPMIARIDKPELTVVGLLVEARWEALPIDIPAAWKALFAREAEMIPVCGPLGEFLEVSLSRDDGIYTEFVGVAVAPRAPTPPGLRRLTVPAGGYLSLVHDGPLVHIAEGFGALYAHAEENGIPVADLKLDIGYAAGLPAGRHELCIAVEPVAPPRIGG